MNDYLSFTAGIAVFVFKAFLSISKGKLIYPAKPYSKRNIFANSYTYILKKMSSTFRGRSKIVGDIVFILFVIL